MFIVIVVIIGGLDTFLTFCLTHLVKRTMTNRQTTDNNNDNNNNDNNEAINIDHNNDNIAVVVIIVAINIDTTRETKINKTMMTITTQKQ